MVAINKSTLGARIEILITKITVLELQVTKLEEQHKITGEKMAILTQTLNQNKGTVRALIAIGSIIGAVAAFFSIIWNIK